MEDQPTNRMANPKKRGRGRPIVERPTAKAKQVVPKTVLCQGCGAEIKATILTKNTEGRGITQCKHCGLKQFLPELKRRR